MSRLFPVGLLAVCLVFGMWSPVTLFGVFDGMSIARADDDADDDDDDDDRRIRPGVRAVRPAQTIRPPSRPRPSVQPKPPPKPRPKPQPQPVASHSGRKPATFEPRDILAINAGPAQLDRAKVLGFTISQTVSLPGLALEITRLRTPAKTNPPQALRILQQRIPDGWFALNHIYRTNAGPCENGRCYGSVLIGWQVSERCGSGLRLGMVDTAADKNHAALNGRTVVTRSFAEDGRPSSTAHGTAVAALLVGAASGGFPGLLPAAELYAADTFIGSDPAKTRTNVLLLAQGFNWLLEQQVSVINISLTGPDNKLLQEAIKRLHQRKLVLVAAAGNGGPSAPPAFPAAYPEAIAVTAVDSLLRPYHSANRGEYVTVAAPGVRIWTPGPQGGQYRDGTSFAAPYGTAVAALLRHQQPGLNPATLFEQMRNSARDLGAPGKDPVFGWGLLQSPGRCE